MKKKIVHPLAFHAEDLKVKCPMKEKKKKETKYTLVFHAEGKNQEFRRLLRKLSLLEPYIE